MDCQNVQIYKYKCRLVWYGEVIPEKDAGRAHSWVANKQKFEEEVVSLFSHDCQAQSLSLVGLSLGTVTVTWDSHGH